MNELRMDIEGRHTHFLPGDEVRGRAVWRLDEPVEAVELRLFWHTSGKGTDDVEIVEVRRFESAGNRGEHEFNLYLPLGPYSFSGTLITLTWSLELVVLPGEFTERVDLIIGPTPVEIRLEDLDRTPLGHNIRIGSANR